MNQSLKTSVDETNCCRFGSRLLHKKHFLEKISKPITCEVKLAANGDKCSNVAKKLTLSLLSAELQSTGNEVIGPQDPDRKKNQHLTVTRHCM